ncbi:MAG: hypothetical protein DRJ97_06245 [Thermoprotei archaeon]|nr:MAG: hypothetical protein DRJ97_06245 [Thermoprotei archaeon]
MVEVLRGGLTASFILLLALMSPAVVAPLVHGGSRQLAQGHNLPSVEFMEVRVASVDDQAVTVVKGGEALRLLVKGGWVAVTEERVERGPWAEVKGLVEEGPATVAVASVGEGDEQLLLGLKQGDVALLSPALIRRCAERRVHTRLYMGVRGEVVHVGGNYLVVERDGRRALAITEGRWLKAGGGEVAWSEVADEFREGDVVRLFCHNVLIMEDEFAEAFGLNAFIWGYSGAIIDLTSGVALQRIPSGA